MITRKNILIPGVFDNEDIASIVYQILQDATWNNDIIESIKIFSEGIQVKSVKFI